MKNIKHQNLVMKSDIPGTNKVESGTTHTKVENADTHNKIKNNDMNQPQELLENVNQFNTSLLTRVGDTKSEITRVGDTNSEVIHILPKIEAIDQGDKVFQTGVGDKENKIMITDKAEQDNKVIQVNQDKTPERIDQVDKSKIRIQDTKVQVDGSNNALLGQK